MTGIARVLSLVSSSPASIAALRWRPRSAFSSGQGVQDVDHQAYIQTFRLPAGGHRSRVGPTGAEYGSARGGLRALKPTCPSYCTFSVYVASVSNPIGAN